MNKIDCLYYKPIVDSYRVQTSDNGDYDIEYELVDEICYLDEKQPKHYNEYNCDKCKSYKSKGVIR